MQKGVGSKGYGEYVDFLISLKFCLTHKRVFVVNEVNRALFDCLHWLLKNETSKNLTKGYCECVKLIMQTNALVLRSVLILKFSYTFMWHKILIILWSKWSSLGMNKNTILNKCSYVLFEQTLTLLFTLNRMQLRGITNFISKLNSSTLLKCYIINRWESTLV